MTNRFDYGEVDYGPLGGLIGSWSGDKGMDIAPESDGTERNPFYETISFAPAGDVTNAESQVLVALSYHQVVSRKSTGKVFHDQLGYWMWEPESGLIMQSLTIPRGVSLMAGGGFSQDKASPKTEFQVRSEEGSEWGIAQSPFMHAKARTISFEHRLTVTEDSLSYFEKTVLDIYGERFDHTDKNVLTKE